MQTIAVQFSHVTFPCRDIQFKHRGKYFKSSKKLQEYIASFSETLRGLLVEAL